LYQKAEAWQRGLRVGFLPVPTVHVADFLPQTMGVEMETVESTTMTTTEDELFFDLDLRVIPIDTKDFDSLNQGPDMFSTVTAANCTCAYDCSYTCRRPPLDSIHAVQPLNMCI
jgi:hypothetical protein